jgi:two-component system, NarL family, sensor kinase
VSLPRLVRNPVAQFLALGMLVIVGIGVGSSYLSARQAAQEATYDARRTTELLAVAVIQPSMTRGLVDAEPGPVDRFDRRVKDQLDLDTARRVKIWAEDGTIVYSDATELIGSRYDLDEEELDVLRHGGTDAEVSDLSKPENRLERDTGGLVEVYTRVWSPEGQPLMFEMYYSTADLERRATEVYQPFQRIMIGSLLALGAVATVMLWLLTRRLTRTAAERERLLRSSAHASEAERRRIARDLHDGVVQDLAGTAYSLSALARDLPATEPSRQVLDTAGGSLRASLRALRSLLVEIHPPDLDAERLDAALEDLTAPAASAGMHAEVDVEGVSGASVEAVLLVWRVAQEAVRNTLRHARAATVRVRVRGQDGRLLLEVADDGVGFDPHAPTHGGSFGLRGLESLVRDSGGRLEVDSHPGRGTVVRLEVSSR